MQEQKSLWSFSEKVILFGVTIEQLYESRSFKPTRKQIEQASSTSNLIWKIIAHNHSRACNRYSTLKALQPFMQRSVVAIKQKWQEKPDPLSFHVFQGRLLSERMYMFKLWETEYNLNGILMCSDDEFEERKHTFSTEISYLMRGITETGVPQLPLSGGSWGISEKAILVGVVTEQICESHSFKATKEEISNAYQIGLSTKNLVWKKILRNFNKACCRNAILENETPHVPRSLTAIKQKWQQRPSPLSYAAWGGRMIKETKYLYNLWEYVYNKDQRLTCSEEKFKEMRREANLVLQ